MKAVLLVGVRLKRDSNIGEFENSLKELSLLAKTNLFEVRDVVKRSLNRYNPKTLINFGAVEEIRAYIKEEKIDLVIFDHVLHPSQGRNLEQEWKVTVIDRTDLIMDIFRKHARTKEAVLQIELASLELLLPKLTGRWTHLDRQVGGIGVRGEGEKQIEMDRREIKKKISTIKKKLAKIERSRINQQKNRQDTFRIALVGYTNTGKSTLVNSLTSSENYADDLLFATLDPRTKRWEIGDQKDVLITDTIGFIRNLPHKLIASFKTTLMEAGNADLIWHVIDSSNSDYLRQQEVVMETLKEIGIVDKPVWNIYNKADNLDHFTEYGEHSDGFYISALLGKGFNSLKTKLYEIL